jgi:hypothetical protein
MGPTGMDFMGYTLNGKDDGLNTARTDIYVYLV